MTEQKLQEIRKLTDRWYEDDEISFQQSSLYDSLLDEVELKESEYQSTITKLNQATNLCREYQQENERLQKQVEFNRKYGIHSNAMKEIERLRKALKSIVNYYGFEGDIAYRDMKQIARKALEGKE